MDAALLPGACLVTPLHPHAAHPRSNLLPRAVCAVLIHPVSQKVLGVSRGKGSKEWGLVGGKVDDTDPSLEAAIAREVFEETGLTAFNLVRKFTDVSAGSDGKEFLTTAFVGQWSGTIQASEEGDVDWVPWETVLRGPFSTYTLKLLSRLALP